MDFNIKNCWFYFLSLSNDMIQTSYYIEPQGQEDVYSFEFSKILILSCVQFEAVVKAICELNGKPNCGNIGEYKSVMLSKYPKIVSTEVAITRYKKTIKPFENWNNEKLFWWEAYQIAKHGTFEGLKVATYKNAVYALSALYIAILYYARETNADFSTNHNDYITSDYEDHALSIGCIKQLPDFED